MSEASAPGRSDGLRSLLGRLAGVPAAVVVLAALAYVPALTAAPGRMPSDSKLYLYLDPGRFFADAASTFDPRQFTGWVPHQHVAYLWPGLPWFWSFELIGVPDWIAHRLWIGTIMLAAGLGVRWLARLLGLGPGAAFTAGVVYQLTPYVLPYVSRTSVLLLPWAGLGWVVGLTVRAARNGGWRDPAWLALVVLTVGAVNATALAMIVPAPLLWLVHSAWQRSITWRAAALAALRIGALSAAVSVWWVAMLLIQSRHGTDVLPYSESLADVSLTASAPETWRSLGYWLFYVRDPFAATTTESLRYLSSTWSIAVSYTLPLGALVAVAFVSWAHRRFAALLIGVGLVLAVGVHPIDDRSPLMRVLAGGDEGGLALALRSSTRALPLFVLGTALALAAAVDAAGRVAWRIPGPTAHQAATGVITILAVVNLPALWTGAFVDPALERDADPPGAWMAAAAALDAADRTGRVLQLPGAEFGAFRWGYTVDQPLPALIDQPLVTRDLLPLGSPAAMDLLYAFDDRVQDGTLEPEAIEPVAQLLGVDTVWLANDLAFDRFRTARPEQVRDAVTSAPGVGGVEAFGEPVVNRPEVPMVDERSLGDERIGEPLPLVELAEIADATGLVRARPDSVVVAGNGDGLVDAAAAGLIDPLTHAVRYAASESPSPHGDALGLLVTDSNRDRARHWRSSQDTTGFTEASGPDGGVLRPVASDARLPVFDTDDATTRTTAEQVGPVTAAATAYGEPFAYLPEHRPFMAIDGDPTTSWIVGEHGNPIGESLRLRFERPVERIVVHQATSPGDRTIATLSIGETRHVLSERSWSGSGQEIVFDSPLDEATLTIESVAGGEPFTASAVAGVGFAEIEHGLGTTREVTRPPTRAVRSASADTPLAMLFTRLRVDPMERWRDDPEPRMVRAFELPTSREFELRLTARVDARASDAELAELFEWPVTASTRLTGSPRHAGVAAFDGDPDTSWITAFGEARGAVLTTTSAVPVDRLTIRQPGAGFSSVDEITLRVGDELRTVSVPADDSGTTTVDVTPALPAGTLTIELTSVVPDTTVDRRFGDVVELPAAIAEIEFAGRPQVASLAAQRWTSPGCVEVARVDRRSITARISVDDGEWLDGGPIAIEPCSPGIALADGAHLLETTDSGLPVTIDRFELDSGLRIALESQRAAEQPSVDVVDDGRFRREIDVGACPTGCWLVFGEGYNDAWSAELDGVDLGTPTLVDGGFNGWWLPASEQPSRITVAWGAQRGLNVALAASLAAGLGCIALVVVARRRQEPDRADAGNRAPVFGGVRSAGRRERIAVAVVWAAAAGLLVGPVWALWGLVGGLAVVFVPRHRWPELVAMSCLAVVAAAVVVRERRNAPPPGGGWPGEFADLHRLAMFAVACVLVAAIAADDATDGEGGAHPAPDLAPPDRDVDDG